MSDTFTLQGEKRDIEALLQKHVDDHNNHTGDHAVYSPSSATRWMNCTGSVALSVDEDDSTSKYAAEGSLAHILCEMLLLGQIKFTHELEELIGNTYMIEGFEIEITEEMTDAAWLYGSTIANDLQEAGLTPDNYKSCIGIEKRVQIANGCSGTSDCYVAIPFEKLMVYDFKYGAGIPVDVQNNAQMKCYAVGALNAYEEDGNSYMENIELVIIQPRARHKDGEVRRWTTTREKVLEFGKEIDQAIADSKKEDAPLKSGTWCRWCPAKHKCPSLFGESQDLAKTAFDVIDTGQDTLLAMTEEQMVMILQKKSTIEGFLKAVEQHALNKLKEGETITGFKLVQGRATRKWYDEDVIAEKFASQVGEENLYTKKFVSPAQLEKVLKSKGIAPSLPKAKELINEYVDPGEGKLTLAPEHDKRQAVMLNPGDYFEDDLEL